MKDLKREDSVNQWNSLLGSEQTEENENIKQGDMKLEDDEICGFKIAFTKNGHIAPAISVNQKYGNDIKALDKGSDEMINFLTDRCLVWVLKTLVELGAHKEILIYTLKNITEQGIELLSLGKDEVGDLFNCE